MGELRDYSRYLGKLPEPPGTDFDSESLLEEARHRDPVDLKPRTKRLRKKELQAAGQEDAAMDSADRFVNKERILQQVDAEIIPEMQFEHLHGFWPEIVEALQREIDTEAQEQLEGLLQWVRHRFGSERKKRLERAEAVVLQEKDNIFKEVVEEAKTYPKVVQQMMVKDSGVGADGRQSAQTNELQRMTYRKFRSLLEREGFLRPASVVAGELSGDEEASLRHLLGSARAEALKEQPWRLSTSGDVDAVAAARKRVEEAANNTPQAPGEMDEVQRPRAA